MILGMTLRTFTLVHVVLSLIGIAAGLVALFGLIGGKRMNRMTALFLSTTVLTSVTGFFFPFHAFGPPHIVGVISLVVLALALAARYTFRMAGPWRRVYIITSTIALYLNCFVGVVQAFQKIPALHALAPTQSKEPAFVAAQLSVLVLFVVLGWMATTRFRAEALATT